MSCSGYAGLRRGAWGSGEWGAMRAQLTPPLLTDRHSRSLRVALFRALVVCPFCPYEPFRNTCRLLLQNPVHLEV